MLVLSGVFNTRILVGTNYANQDYMRVNYTLCPNSNLQPIKKISHLPRYGPIAIADWSILGQTWVLASNDAVFEMGDVIRTLKRLLLESI
jgi:hypothetical protein